MKLVLAAVLVVSTAALPVYDVESASNRSADPVVDDVWLARPSAVTVTPVHSDATRGVE